MGRDSEIKAQQQLVESLRAAVAMAQWRIDQRYVTAPVTSVVADVLARPGETIPADGPVVSLLPPENIFVRFFVPEAQLAGVHAGDGVALLCDQCLADLVCIVLMMSTLFMTALSITRERERGTMENLLAMPARPIEVMLAKMVPYVFIGYVQVLLLLVASAVFFQLPLPLWAQWIGEVFPTTHAMRIVRGVLIKGNASPDILPDLWPIALFMAAVVAVAVWCYRETLE
jgi:hypothetical protein